MAAPPPPPVSPLARYRILSPRCALRVSPLQLGGMSLGTRWKHMLGSITKEEGFTLLDEYYKLGGNFIDTANNYSEGESEQWIGEWMKERGNREDLVIATKYTSLFESAKPSHKVNYVGNGYKSLHRSVEKSLENLQTHYIDLLYLHWWDYTTSIEEVMQSLNILVTSGKVLYLGISDAPAWIVSKANQYARDHGMAQFVVYQGKWSALDRDLERDCIPMSLHEGMAIAPYGVLGSGKFQSKAALEQRKKEGEGLRMWVGRNTQIPKEIEMSGVLESIGEELGASVTAVALAYTLQKYPYVFPIVGGRKISHLHDNIKSLTIQLTPAHFDALEKVADFNWGFPYNAFGRDPSIVGVNYFMNPSGTYDFVKPQPAILPPQ